MEYLPHSLSQLLESKVPIKADSILLDVANGLNYLHQKQPPIIHRDLSANNVLLTTEHKAKISDLGVSKLADANAMKQKLTTTPGTICMMPPEALQHNPVYDHKLDVFSFGCLILHVLTGQTPLPTLQYAPKPNDPGSFVQVSEWDRRASYIEQVPRIHLVKQCLENDPSRRPNMNEVIEEIQHHNRHDPSHRLEQQLRQKEQELQKYRNQLQEDEKKKAEKELEIQSCHYQLQEKNRELQEKERELQEKKRELQKKERELRQSQDAARIYQQQVSTDDHWVINKDEVILTEEELGRGSYATVKVGTFRGLRVAVKSLHTIIISDYNLALFSREMSIASRVRHPNLVQFIGATKVGNPLVLTELMNTSLYKELQEKELTRQQILSIAQDVALGLNYLHLFKPQPIIHRDIGSPDILLKPSTGPAGYEAKVADYGTANLQGSCSTIMPGNPAYAAPEARDPDQHSPAMDVYSYSVLLMEITLRSPPEMTTVERERQSCNVSWSPMKSLIQRGLNTTRQDRPTMSQVIEALKEIMI